MALIELEEGIRLVSNVVDVSPAAVRAGLAVEVCFAPTARRTCGASCSDPREGSDVPELRSHRRDRSDANFPEFRPQRAAAGGGGLKAALDDAGIRPADVDGMISLRPSIRATRSA